MGTLAHICTGVIFTATALAQSAVEIRTQAPAPQKAPNASSASDLTKTASRHLDSAGLAPYIDAASSTFSIRRRARDPFGHSQDPDAKPVAQTSTAKTARRAAPILATPFSEIVQLITITTIMPGEKRFLIGTRSISQGDQIAITFRGRHIPVEITEVTARQIGFRNRETAETAMRRLDLLPPGMTPGNQEITNPAIQPYLPNAPINLEAGDPTP